MNKLVSFMLNITVKLEVCVFALVSIISSIFGQIAWWLGPGGTYLAHWGPEKVEWASCSVWSVEFEVQSVEFGVRSFECEVGWVWCIEHGVWILCAKFGVWSMECEVCVFCLVYGVWSVNFVCWVWCILRFILPCKSDCYSIFLKKRGIYSLYANLWLLRPLIKNIPDSSHQYGSNVTFGASLAFQIREEYVFEENIFFENWTSRGVNTGVTQFHTQFTHVSRQC